MPDRVDAYYDFRSPYAHFANHRLNTGAVPALREVEWRWRPVSIDILLNLQAGREPWAAYVDPLSPPKRAHFMADLRRMSGFYGAPLRTPNPPRPNTVPALCVAHRLEGAAQEIFRNAVFTALWREQMDVADVEVLKVCLNQAGADESLADAAFSAESRDGLAERTVEAYAAGVFGVPTFVHDGEVFFGADRLDLLAWKLERRVTKA